MGYDMLYERITYLDEVDYLQIFNLNPVLNDSEMLQEISHMQKIPKCSKTVVLYIPNPVKNKILVVRSQHKTEKKYWTMLLAEKY